MPILLEHFSLVIRRDSLEALLPGGWPQFLAEYGEPYENWVDDDLVRFGAMNGLDLDGHVAHWRQRGLALVRHRDGRPDRGDMLLHAALSATGAVQCDWLEISDDGFARFVGKKRRQRRPRIHSSWSDELVALTRDMVLDLLARAPVRRPPLMLKNWDERFGILSTDENARKGLHVTDLADGTLQSFRLTEDLLNAGWVVD